MSAAPWLIALLSSVAGAATIAWLRWRLGEAREDAEMYERQAIRLVGEVRAAAAARDEAVARREAVIRGLRAELEGLRSRLSALLAAAPHLAGKHLGGELRRAADSWPAAPGRALPDQPTAAAPEAGGEER